MRMLTKEIVGRVVTQTLPVADYRNTLFVLSHMRSVSTALTNVLCSHELISGYGETHVPYTRSSSVGQMAVNVMRRRAWKPNCRLLLDKVLHSSLDGVPSAGFYKARGIFLVRSPGPAISSIVSLATHEKDLPFKQREAAAIYYRDRLRQLRMHWHGFPPERRAGLTTEDLLSDPSRVLARLGDQLGLVPGLTNSYFSHPASQIGGGGDPIRSGQHRAISARPTTVDLSPIEGVSPQLSKECISLFEELKRSFSVPSFHQPA